MTGYRHWLAAAGIALLTAPAQAAAPAAKPAAKPAATTPALAPEAKAALARMGAYLRSLKSFEVTATGFGEDVLESGQKLTMPGSLTYAVVVPNKLFAEVASDRSLRRFYFDGSKVTIDAPRHKLYSDAPLAGTIETLLRVADEKYGISLPLQDLFMWGNPARPVPDPASGFLVGVETVGTTKVDHFAFRQPGVDWQIWIAEGDKPLPLRIVIINRDDAAKPAYAADLVWKTDGAIPPDRFIFTPGADSARIDLATIGAAKGDAK